MSRTFLLSAVLAICSIAPAVGAPMLLVKFTYEKEPKFGGVGSPPVRDWEY